VSDGNIVAARGSLDRAIRALIAPRPGVYADQTRYAPSLYHQLSTELAGAQGDNKTSAKKSLPPAHIDAVQLKFDIDRQTAAWVPKPGDTPHRLEILSVQLWRPQDTKQVYDMSRMLRGWCDRIVHLLDPTAVMSLSTLCPKCGLKHAVACPSCGRTHVYGRDPAGEVVRQPALQLVANVGCTCRHCEAHWSPDRYLFLSKLLGFELPDGVLE